MINTLGHQINYNITREVKQFHLINVTKRFNNRIPLVSLMSEVQINQQEQISLIGLAPYYNKFHTQETAIA